MGLTVTLSAAKGLGTVRGAPSAPGARFFAEPVLSEAEGPE